MTTTPPQPEITSKPLISIAIPAYNEAPNLEMITQAIVEALPEENLEIIFINDGSQDHSPEILERLAQERPYVKYVSFSRNFGQRQAIKAGIDYARGECIIIMDADLQHPPGVLPQFLAAWRAGYDVVQGVRLGSSDDFTWAKKLTSKSFRWLMSQISNVEIMSSAPDFRLISKRVAQNIRDLREDHYFLRGLIPWLGFKQTIVHYNQEARQAGATAYTYKRMFKLALEDIVSFSTLPLKLATFMGLVAILMALIYAAFILVATLLGQTTSGWPSTMLVILFLGGTQLVCLGIIGEYIGRIHLKLKIRPDYVVDKQNLD